MLRIDLRAANVGRLNIGYNATLIMDFYAAVGSWPHDSSGLYRSAPYAANAPKPAPRAGGRGLRDGDEENAHDDEPSDDEDAEGRREDDQERQEDEEEKRRHEVERREDEGKNDGNENDTNEDGEEGDGDGGDKEPAAEGSRAKPMQKESVLLVTQFETQGFRKMAPAMGDEPMYKAR